MSNINIELVRAEEAPRIRDYCLSIIKEVYGYNYRPDWHTDLDDLLNPHGMYSENVGGVFLSATSNGEIVGTIGLRSLQTKPTLFHQFKFRYDNYKVASIWRAYVRSDKRGKGIGTELTRKAEEFAKAKGYELIYLHSSRNNPEALKFWHTMGYKIFSEEENQDRTVHMDKHI